MHQRQRQRGRRLLRAAPATTLLSLALVASGCAPDESPQAAPAGDPANAGDPPSKPTAPASPPDSRPAPEHPSPAEVSTTADGTTNRADDTTSAMTAPLARSRPVSVSIPRTNLTTDHIVRLGLTEQRHLEVPQAVYAVGWFKLGPTPGERGPTIMAGHVSHTGQAVFDQLDTLQSGDQVTVQRADGTTVNYTVYKTARYDKDSFPTDAVYGETPQSELRLITCAGRFDVRTESYHKNLVVYARISGVSSAGGSSGQG